MIRAWLAACLLLLGGAASAEPALPPGLKLDRVVLLMRHGVRPPTKSPPLPAGTANQPWPDWPVKPGYLTPHGEAAVRLISRFDRETWIAAGVFPRTGCAGLRVVADSDQRTIATGDAYAAAFAPGCPADPEHKPQDVTDPLFSPLDDKPATFDAARARQDIERAAGAGGLGGEDARMRSQLARLDAILCAPLAATCGVAREPTGLTAPGVGERPKLTGALDRASTAAQILLLEYAEGKPMSDVGWGRATEADIARLSAFHTLEFQLLVRPPYVAHALLTNLAPLIGDALTSTGAAPVTMIAGHDTNVAAMGGLLGLHWQVPGLAPDDPSPGGAIVFEHLRDRDGHGYVRALYRSQTVEQIRMLTSPADGQPYVALLPIARCTARGVKGLCTDAEFRQLLAAS